MSEPPASPSSPDRSMLRRWTEHAFAQGWVCIRSRIDGCGHVAIDEHAKSSRRPTLDECLAHAEGGGNVEVLLHESDLFQVDAERGAPAPWGDHTAHAGACISRSAGEGLHAIYAQPQEVPKHRWIKPVPGVDLLTKGVWPLPGCRRTGNKRKPAGEWSELAPPLAPGPPPAWVLKSVPRAKSRRTTAALPPVPNAGAWAMAALSGELAAVAAATAGDGRAHATMMSSGARLGQIVGAGHLDRESVMEQLVAAAMQAGWQDREARRCANDSIEFGTKNPRGPAELPGIEIVNGAAAEAPGPSLQVPAGENSAEASALPAEPSSLSPAQPEPDRVQEHQQPPEEGLSDPASPKAVELRIGTLDDALALLDQAKEARDVEVLFKHAGALADLSLADEAIFLQRARKTFKKKLAKSELARAIHEQRKAKREETKAARVAEAQMQRKVRRSCAVVALRNAASTSKRVNIELYSGDLTRDPKSIHDNAVAALVAGNAPERLFVRAARPARIGVDEEGQPTIERVKDKEMQSELLRSAIFIGHNPSGLPQPVDPPVATLRTLLGCGNLPFPRLAGIVRAPVLRRDGSILMQPGYDKETGLYYQADSGLVIPVVPGAPSAEEVRQARELILEVFSQFPFGTEASRANSVALQLTPFLQPVVDDNRPLCAISAFQPGSGKGEIAGACSRVSTGRPPRMTRLRREEEFEKKLAHLMYCGAPFICIDNAKGRLESETLESALTNRRFSDRRLGRNDDGFDVPQDATWCATGNNLELGTEMARRSYPVELDPKNPHPEDREGPRPGEKFKRLPAWVMENRGQLVWAVLTLCRAWFAAGCPRPNLRTFGNFERWQDVVGGVLEVAGIPDFLGNRSQLRADQDEEAKQWGAFLREIRRTTGDQAFTTRQLVEGIEKHVAIRDALPDEVAAGLDRDDFVQRLGDRLRKKMGRRFGADGLRVVRLEDDGHEKVAQWQVVVDQEGGADGAA